MWRARIRYEACWREKSLEKPDGSVRIIHAPCSGLKRVQRLLNKTVLAPLDRNEYAFCRKGRGVLQAVRLHLEHPALLHRDLKSFFPSVKSGRVKLALRSVGFTPEDAALIATVTTHESRLPQGAPTSVTLGNLALWRLDLKIGALCQRMGLSYTRYVDDIAVSGGEGRLRKAEARLDRMIKEDGWRLSEKGGLFATGAYREYLGVCESPGTAPRARSNAKLEKAHDDLENGIITYDEFLTRTSWARAIAKLYERIGGDAGSTIAE